MSQPLTKVVCFLAGIALLASCAGESTTGPLTQAPAQLVFNIAFQSSATSGEEIRIASSYLKQNGSTVLLSQQTLKLSGQTEQVPVGIDLARCLADSERVGGGDGAAAANECMVVLEVRLFVDGVQVDQQTVGPLLLRPGVATTVSSAVQLNDIFSIRIDAPSENIVGEGQPLRLELTHPMTLTATALDKQQQPISGRAAQWTSSNTSIATVSSSGVVTGIATGSVQVSANIGGHASSVNVNVVPAPAAITISAAGISGTGTVTSSPTGIACTISGSNSTGACTSIFPGDANVVLTATAANNSEFLAWVGDCSTAQQSSCSLDMSQPHAVGVVFRALSTLNVEVAGSGNGVVTSESGEINCRSTGGSQSGACTTTLREGSMVTLHAAAGTQSSFTGWTGDCSEVSGTTCKVVLSNSSSVTAQFDMLIPITVAGTGNGSGNVVSNPTAISCSLTGSSTSGTCNSSFPVGSQVVFTATPAAQNGFTGWAGCTQVSGNTCTLVVPESPATISAHFAAPSLLTVVPTGNGDGLVSGSTISCSRSNLVNSGKCSDTFAGGAMITLSASAGSYSFFAGWTGGTCSGTDDCLITMDQAKTVGALFSRQQVTLKLILVGPNPGSVQVGGGAICTIGANDDSTECNIMVDLQRDVTISAADGSTIEYFSGACASNSNSCTFRATGASTVAVKFGSPSLTVNINGEGGSTGGGTVYSSQLDMACEMNGGILQDVSRCRQVIPQDEVPNSVVFSAYANQTSIFDGWGGACSFAGSSPYCTINNPSGVLDITARFSALPSVNLAISLSGERGTVVIAGDGFSYNCTRTNPEAIPNNCLFPIPSGAFFTVGISSSYASYIFTTSSPTPICSGDAWECYVTSYTAPHVIAVSFLIDSYYLHAPPKQAHLK